MTSALVGAALASAAVGGSAVDWWARSIAIGGVALALLNLFLQRRDARWKRRAASNRETRQALRDLRSGLISHAEPQLVAMVLWSTRYAAALEDLKENGDAISDRKTRKLVLSVVADCESGRGLQSGVGESHERVRSVNRPVDVDALSRALIVVEKAITRLDKISRRAPG